MDEDIEQMHIFQFEYVPQSGGLSLVIDNQRNQVSFGDQIVRLSPLQYRLLNILMRRAGRTVSRADLLRFLQKSEEQSGARVLTNTVSDLRKALSAVMGEDVEIPIVTHGSHYGFDGDVVAEAQIAETPTNAAHLETGMHLATARGTLSERFYINHGIEGWTVSPTSPREKHHFARIAISREGYERLRREKAVYDLIAQQTQDEPLVIAPDVNFAMAHHQSLMWPAGAKSLQSIMLSELKISDLSVVARVDFAARIVNALSRLHALGIIHGDLKPATIVYPDEPAPSKSAPLLAGLAHAYVPPHGLKTSPVVDLAFQRRDWNARQSDSVGYRAPELLNNPRISHKSDIYALGVLIYQIVTGDIGRALEVNWQEDIPCPVLRSDISNATARHPETRTSSAAELYEALRDYKGRKREYDSDQKYKSELEALKRQREEARKRRPFYAAIAGLLLFGICGLGWMNLQLQASTKHAETEALAAQSARNLLLTVLIEADPRQSFAPKDLSVDRLLERARNQILVNHANDPSSQIQGYLTLAYVERGRANVRGERDALKLAITAMERQSPLDEEELLGALYAFAILVSHIGETDSQEAPEKYDAAEEIIEKADALYARRTPRGDAAQIAKAYARGTLSSRNGDFQDTYEGLSPWIALVKETNPPLDRRGYNAAILLAQAAFRIGKPIEAIELLDWLGAYPNTEVPDWIGINRLTLQAQILASQNAPETLQLYETALSKAQSVYSGPSIPEANLRTYLGVYFEKVGRFADAVREQERAQDMLCESFGDGLYCQGLELQRGRALAKLDRFEEALESLNVARPVYERSHPAGVPATDFALAMVYVGLGDYDAAKRRLNGLTSKALEQEEPGAEWSLQLDLLRQIVSENRNDDVFHQLMEQARTSGIPIELTDWFARRFDERAASARAASSSE